MPRWLLVVVLVFGGLVAWRAAPAQDEDDHIPPWEREGDDDDSAGDEDDEEREGEAHEDEGEAEPPVDVIHEVDHEDDSEDDDPDEDDDPEEDDGFDDEDDDEDDYKPQPDSRHRLDPIDVYHRDRLKLWRYRTAEEYPNALAALFRPRVRWGVRSASGEHFSALQMARFLEDGETWKKASAQQAGWISLGAGLAVAGVGILVGGTATYGIANSREDEGRGGGRRGSLQSAEGALTAGLLLGPILIGAGTSVTIGGVRRTRHVARYYDREDAEDAIEEYNERLMRRLDLDWEDVEARDLRAPPVRVRLAVGPASIGLSLRF